MDKNDQINHENTLKNNLKISFFAAKDLLSPSINSGFPSGFLL